MFPNSGLLEMDEPGRQRPEVNPVNTWLADTVVRDYARCWRDRRRGR